MAGPERPLDSPKEAEEDLTRPVARTASGLQDQVDMLPTTKKRTAAATTTSSSEEGATRKRTRREHVDTTPLSHLDLMDNVSVTSILCSSAQRWLVPGAASSMDEETATKDMLTLLQLRKTRVDAPLSARYPVLLPSLATEQSVQYIREKVKGLRESNQRRNLLKNLMESSLASRKGNFLADSLRREESRLSYRYSLDDGSVRACHRRHHPRDTDESHVLCEHLSGILEDHQSN